MGRRKPIRILATYTYAKALLDGMGAPEAKERGVVAAIMGAKARAGRPGGSRQADEHAAERKRKSTITAESFDRQVADKMDAFFEESFLPAIKRLVAKGMSYDEVKSLVKIPRLWGAKISGERFEKRAMRSKRWAISGAARDDRIRTAILERLGRHTSIADAPRDG